MNYDNYYYDRDGSQIDYIKNDQPDRFFVLDDNGDTKYNEKNYSEVGTASEIGHLARITYAEAGGENQTSKEAVADVVRNRVESSRFPNTYKDVAEQKTNTKCGIVYQFSSVDYYDKSSWRYSNPLSTKNQSERTAFANSVSAAIKIFYGENGITNGALLYYSPKSMVPTNSKPGWNFNLLQELTIPDISTNNFKFYKYK